VSAFARERTPHRSENSAIAATTCADCDACTDGLQCTATPSSQRLMADYGETLQRRLQL